jgi:hypothetical protein
MSDIDHEAEYDRTTRVLNEVYEHLRPQLAGPFVQDAKDIDYSGL